jgi:hypothetical protein
LGDAWAQRVDGGIIYGDDSDAVFFCELDEIVHGENPWIADLEFALKKRKGLVAADCRGPAAVAAPQMAH